MHAHVRFVWLGFQICGGVSSGSVSGTGGQLGQSVTVLEVFFYRAFVKTFHRCDLENPNYCTVLLISSSVYGPLLGVASGCGGAIVSLETKRGLDQPQKLALWMLRTRR